ncbi:MAG TPA: carboxypeptidase regulatory-like domain-containing protein, partial [Candidatus Bathyarchaeota archaeon]|nr:carboxypeptidase regulatory-like domain-containing protein [Candidatus Bathyarchaeota archaeon]
MIRVKKALVVLMAITLLFAGLISNSYVSADDLGTLLRIDVYIKSDTDLRILNAVVFVNESSVNREIRQYIDFIKGNASIPLIQPKSLVKQNLILYISNRIPPGRYNISVYLRAMIGSQSKRITYSLINSTTVIAPMSERIVIAQLYFTIRETDFTRKLEWTCPTPPSKYAPPTTSKPFNATLIYESVSPEQELVYLLVNDTLYNYQLFVMEFNLFVRDLSSLGYSVKTYLISGGTPSDLRSLLRDGLDEGLVGAILIGDLPVAWYEMYCWERWEQFPTDLFYMDLDGSFTDSDNDGLFDSHSDGEGDRAPEIWIGHLDVPNKYSDVEYQILAYYFYRHHLYVTGEITVPHRALIYIDDDWVSMADSVDNSLAKIYSERVLVTDEETTNSEDYKARLAEGYEWVHLQCHGWPGGHTFKVPSGWNGTVYTSDYEAIDPPVFFYQFFVCSGARFVENDYLAGSAVFKTSYGLAAIGSTKTGSMLYFSDFYTKLAERKSIGEAFKEWFILHGESMPCWFYGMTIIGSPVLTPKLEKAKIYGWVRDLSGNVIEGATVEVYNYTSRELLNSSVTDEEGYYEMSVPYGNMYLIIHKNGYYTYSSDVFYNIALTKRNATLTPILPEEKDVMLVVDDDTEYWIDQGTWPEEIRAAIERAGYDVYTWNESVQGLPSLEALEDARAVFWHTGTGYHYAISELDAETLLQYVRSGGRLVLEGEDIGYDHRNDTFMQKVAHANYHVDIASGNLAMVLPLHRITSGLPLDIRFEHNPPYPDGVSPVAEAFKVLQYESGYSAVIGYDNATNGGSRIIYISFPVHYLSKTIRDVLIANSINWVIKRPVYLVVRGMNNRIYYNLMLD